MSDSKQQVLDFINAWNRLAIAGGLGGLVESDLAP